MKPLTASLLLAAGFFAAWVARPVEAQNKVADRTIRAGAIVLVDEDGKERVTLQASRSGSGVWVRGPRGESVSLFAAPGQGAALGFHTDPGKAPFFCDFAVSANRANGDGGPALQVVGADGRPRVMDVSRLAPAVSP